MNPLLVVREKLKYWGGVSELLRWLKGVKEEKGVEPEVSNLVGWADHDIQGKDYWKMYSCKLKAHILFS